MQEVVFSLDIFTKQFIERCDQKGSMYVEHYVTLNTDFHTF